MRAVKPPHPQGLPGEKLEINGFGEELTSILLRLAPSVSPQTRSTTITKS
jgi:hypothetical protein